MSLYLRQHVPLAIRTSQAYRSPLLPCSSISPRRLDTANLSGTRHTPLPQSHKFSSLRSGSIMDSQQQGPLRRSQRSRSVRSLDSWRPGMDGGVRLNNNESPSQDAMAQKMDSMQLHSQLAPPTLQAAPLAWSPAPYPAFYTPPHAPFSPASSPFTPPQFNPISFTPINPNTGRLSHSRKHAPVASQTRKHHSYTPKVPQPETPIPTPEYIQQANRKPGYLPYEAKNPLLVVLDLNGTLIYRDKRRNPRSFIKRPGVELFLDYLFKNHQVMIWSSSKLHTIHTILEHLPIRQEYIAIWSREDLDLTPEQYREKVQVYKRLDKLWANKVIQSHHFEFKKMKKNYLHYLSEQTPIRLDPEHDPIGKMFWNQTNTVLIDDSRIKAAAQPHNILQISEYTGGKNPDDAASMAIIIRQLDILSRQKDVSAKIRRWNEEIPQTQSATEIAKFWQKKFSLPFYKGNLSALSLAERYIMWAQREPTEGPTELGEIDDAFNSPRVTIRLSDQDLERKRMNKEYQTQRRLEAKKAKRQAKRKKAELELERLSSPVPKAAADTRANPVPDAGLHLATDAGVSAHFDAAIGSSPAKPLLSELSGSSASDSDKSPGGVELRPN